MYISIILLTYSLMCYILLVFSIFSSEWSLDRPSIKDNLNNYLKIFKRWVASGFLCLQATNNGVSIVPQKDTFAPQIVWYDAFNQSEMGPSHMDKMAIHMLFTYMRMHYGVPNININNINDLHSTPISKYLEHPQTIGAKIDSEDSERLVLVELNHHGKLVERKIESNILKTMRSENKLDVFK